MKRSRLSPRDVRGDADSTPDRGDVNVGVEVSEVCGNPGIGAGKEMIEHDGGEPILEMGAACLSPIGKVLVLGNSHRFGQPRFGIDDWLSVHVQNRLDRGVAASGSCFVEIVL